MIARNDSEVLIASDFKRSPKGVLQIYQNTQNISLKNTDTKTSFFFFFFAFKELVQNNPVNMTLKDAMGASAKKCLGRKSIRCFVS